MQLGSRSEAGNLCHIALREHFLFAVVVALDDHSEVIDLSPVLASRALILRQDVLQDLGLLALVVDVADGLHDGSVPLNVVLADAASTHAHVRVPLNILFFKLLPFFTLQLASVTLLEVDVLCAILVV